MRSPLEGFKLFYEELKSAAVLKKFNRKKKSK